MNTCQQEDCSNVAAFRFTWPGRDEAGICEDCAPILRMLAHHLGFHLQLIPLDTAEDTEEK